MYIYSRGNVEDGAWISERGNGNREGVGVKRKEVSGSVEIVSEGESEWDGSV